MGGLRRRRSGRQRHAQARPDAQRLCLTFSASRPFRHLPASADAALSPHRRLARARQPPALMVQPPCADKGAHTVGQKRDAALLYLCYAGLLQRCASQTACVCSPWAAGLSDRSMQQSLESRAVQRWCGTAAANVSAAPGTGVSYATLVSCQLEAQRVQDAHGEHRVGRIHERASVVPAAGEVRAELRRR